MVEMAASSEFDAEVSVVEALQRRDPGAFEEMLRRHDRWVRGVVFGVLGSPDRVEDVSQQVWAAVWERASELRDAPRWKAWLYRLARNAAVDAGRDVTRRKQLTARLTDEPRESRSRPTPADALQRGQDLATAVFRRTDL